MADPKALQLARARLRLAESQEQPMPVQPTPEPDYVQRIKAENQQKLEQNPGWVTDENMPTPSDNFRAGAQGATAGLAPRLMDQFQAAKSDPMNYLRDVVKPDGASNVQRVPVGTEYRDQYMDAAKKVPAARIAGSVMNPLNRIGGGLVSNVVGGAVMEGTEQATGTGDMDAGNIAMSGAVNAAFPKIMQAGGSVLDFAASKMAGPALNLVKDMAEQILQKRASVTGQALQDYTREGSSKMGFKTLWDDILYTVIDKIDPKIFQRQATRTGNIQGALKGAGQVLQSSAAPIDQATMRSGALSGRLNDVADDTMRSVDPKITSGVPASKVIRQEFASQPGNVNADTEYPLAQIRKKMSQVNNTQYQKAAMPQIPQKAVQQATGQVDKFLVKQSGMTPDQAAAYGEGKAGFERTKKTSDIYFDSAAKAEPSGLQRNTMGDIVTDMVVRPLKSKGAQVVYSGAKKAAQKALTRLQKRFGTGNMTNMSPLQADTIKAKLRTIAQMDPAESAAYVYAQSMMNPVFRAIWNERDNDNDD